MLTIDPWGIQGYQQEHPCYEVAYQVKERMIDCKKGGRYESKIRGEGRAKI
jgi:hypothetical protein